MATRSSEEANSRPGSPPWNEDNLEAKDLGSAFAEGALPLPHRGRRPPRPARTGDELRRSVAKRLGSLEPRPFPAWCRRRAAAGHEHLVPMKRECHRNPPRDRAHPRPQRAPRSARTWGIHVPLRGNRASTPARTRPGFGSGGESSPPGARLFRRTGLRRPPRGAVRGAPGRPRSSFTSSDQSGEETEPRAVWADEGGGALRCTASRGHGAPPRDIPLGQLRPPPLDELPRKGLSAHVMNRSSPRRALGALRALAAFSCRGNFHPKSFTSHRGRPRSRPARAPRKPRHYY